MNISRNGGFPLCAESLEILANNAAMTEELLKAIPIENRTAVFFKDRKHVLYCLNGINRIAHVSGLIPTDLSNCKLTVTTTTHDVEDGDGNTYSSVYETTSVVISTATGASDRWKFVDMGDVLNTNIWEDHLPAFSSGLASATLPNSPGRGFNSVPTLYGTNNKLKSNRDKLRMYLRIYVNLEVYPDTVLHIPFANNLGGYFRVNANLQRVGTGGNYPLRGYINSNEMVFNIGRLAKEEGLLETVITGTSLENNNYTYIRTQRVSLEAVLYINEEFVLW